MFSSSVVGGSICVGCRLRAVSRRTAATTKLATAPARMRTQNVPKRRHYTSEATGKRAEQDLEAIINAQRHSEKAEKPGKMKEYSSWATEQPQINDDWDTFIEEALPPEPDKAPSHGYLDTVPQKTSDETDGLVAQHLVRRSGSGIQRDRPLPPVEQPVERVRKGNTFLQVERPKLSVPSLGREAEVIVLREGGRWVRKPLNWDRRAPAPGPVLQEVVDQEVGLGMELVLENLDALRPEHRILPASEFKTVFDQLMKGFSSPQLQAYLARHQQRIEDGEESLFLGRISEPTLKLPWITEQAIWTPEVEGAVEDIPQSLKGYILRTMPPKQRLAMQLMRQCWALSVQELMDGPGILEVLIRDEEFKLLTLGHQKFLRLIARNNLSRGKGKALEVIKSRQVIRFLAPKAISEQCLNFLDAVLQKKKSTTISMESIPLKDLEPDTFQELGRMSDSLVIPDKKRRVITITWLHTRDNALDGKVEDVGDVVFRLLQTAHHSSRINTSLAIHPFYAEKIKFIEDISSKEKLSWMDRRNTWARLCLPLAKKEPRTTVINPLSQDILQYEVQSFQEDFELPRAIRSVLREQEVAFLKTLEGTPLSIPKGDRPIKEPPKDEAGLIRTNVTSSGWLPFRVRTKAVFGHILHQPNTDLSPLGRKKFKFLSDNHRVFSPLIPPIDGMSLPGWLPYRIPSNLEAYLILRFIPFSDDPNQPQHPLAPQLELCMTASGEEVIGIDCLRAICHTHVADICLPSQFVDVRTTQRLVARLAGHGLDSTDGMKPLNEFLEKCIFNIPKAKLVTPPRITNLGLPRWMFYRPEADLNSPFLSPRALKRLKRTRKRGTAAAGGAAALPLAFDDVEPSENPIAYAEQIGNEAFNSLRHVSYLFAGLEVHRPFSTTFDGWRLTYTSIEAGQGGGRRAELALLGMPGPDKLLRRGAARVNAKNFVSSVNTLARGDPGKLVQRPGDSEGEGVRTRIGWVERRRSDDQAFGSTYVLESPSTDGRGTR